MCWDELYAAILVEIAPEFKQAISEAKDSNIRLKKPIISLLTIEVNTKILHFGSQD